MQNNINVVDEVRREVSALNSELNSIQAHLRLVGESADLLLLEKLSLTDKMAQLQRSFPAEFEDTREDSEASPESYLVNQDVAFDDKASSFISECIFAI